jgi:hypothetical protein
MKNNTLLFQFNEFALAGRDKLILIRPSPTRGGVVMFGKK